MSKNSRRSKKREAMEASKTSKDAVDYHAGGWANTTNGFGPETDPNFSTSFLSPVELSDFNLTQLYKTNPLVTSYIDLWRGDTTRKGFEVIDKENADLATNIKEDLVKRFNINGLLSKIVGVERLYGGGVIYCDIDDGNDPKDPLNEKTIRKINGFIPIEKEYARVASYNDLIGVEDPGAPLHYSISLMNPIQSQTVTVHKSRVIRMPEISGDSNLSILPMSGSAYPTWPINSIQKAYDSIKRYGVGMQSLSQQLQNLVIDIFRTSNQSSIKDPAEFRGWIRSQWALKNSLRANIIGEHDSLERITTNLAGIENLIEQINKDVSMALGVPMSILFSLEAGGLGGSTITGDRLVWFDKVNAYQNKNLVPAVSRIIELTGFEAKKDYSKVTVYFNPLHELTELEKMQARNLGIDAMTKLVMLGLPAKDALDSMLSGGEMNFTTVNYNKNEIDEFMRDGEDQEDNDEKEDNE